MAVDDGSITPSDASVPLIDSYQRVKDVANGDDSLDDNEEKNNMDLNDYDKITMFSDPRRVLTWICEWVKKFKATENLCLKPNRNWSEVLQCSVMDSNFLEADLEYF